MSIYDNPYTDLAETGLFGQAFDGFSLHGVTLNETHFTSNSPSSIMLHIAPQSDASALAEFMKLEQDECDESVYYANAATLGQFFTAYGKQNSEFKYFLTCINWLHDGKHLLSNGEFSTQKESGVSFDEVFEHIERLGFFLRLEIKETEEDDIRCLDTSSSKKLLPIVFSRTLRALNAIDGQ